MNEKSQEKAIVSHSDVPRISFQFILPCGQQRLVVIVLGADLHFHSVSRGLACLHVHKWRYLNILDNAILQLVLDFLQSVVCPLVILFFCYNYFIIESYICFASLGVIVTPFIAHFSLSAISWILPIIKPLPLQ